MGPQTIYPIYCGAASTRARGECRGPAQLLWQHLSSGDALSRDTLRHPIAHRDVRDLSVPDRFWLLSYWGSLITGYFSVQERPIWGDGKQIHFCGELQEDDGEPYSQALHDIYRESLKGYTLLVTLLEDPDLSVRMGAAWVPACLPTMAPESVPLLEGREESSGWVRAATAFALGELGAAGPLRRMLAEDDFPAVRCMAACQLARLEPDAALINPLLDFVANQVEGYENIPGTGGKASGDAAHSISLLPAEVQVENPGDLRPARPGSPVRHDAAGPDAHLGRV